MKKIIIATDFSPAAYNAAKYAADMALAVKAEVLLLNVYTVPVTYMEVPVMVTAGEIQEGAEANMSKLKAALNFETDNNLTINTEVREGFFFNELKTVCEREHPYLVVMGSQGKTAAERLILGSEAVNAMKHLDWPVMTVPPTASFYFNRKIGLACDFDNVAENVPVEEIKLLVTDFFAELHVLNTGKKNVFNPDLVFESQTLQEKLKSLNPRYHFISNDDIDEGILEFAEKNHLDLLIVLPKRHSLLEKIFHRSHTKQIVLHSHIPVMALQLSQ